MMKLKRIGALVLVLAMIAMVGAAYASSVETLTGGVVDSEHNTTTTAENTILLLKELVIYNTDGEAIYLPSVNYSYTIAEATAADGVGDTIGDAQDPQVTGTVYADNTDTNGRALQTTSATVQFAPSTTADETGYYTAAGAATTLTQPVVAAAAGTSIYKGIQISFTPANFDHAGVYRYKITESTTDRTSAGVTTGEGTNAARYLDVYVRAIDTSDPADGVNDSYAIYGYVCFTDPSTPIDGSDAATVTAAKKTNGYVHSAEDVTTVADQYYTKNLEVKKDFGSSALNQTSHQFPFTVTVDSGANGAGAWMNAAATTGAKTTGFTTSGTHTYVVLADDGTVVSGLSDDQVIELYGIPTEAGVSVQVHETNDTYDAYSLTATVANSSVTEISAVNKILTANQNSDDTVAVPIDKDTKTAITFTNDLTEISPTGLVIRFAPYALMLIGGIALLIVAKKHNRHAEDEEK